MGVIPGQKSQPPAFATNFTQVSQGFTQKLNQEACEE
jgi:hypothetical protein